MNLKLSLRENRIFFFSADLRCAKTRRRIRLSATVDLWLYYYQLYPVYTMKLARRAGSSSARRASSSSQLHRVNGYYRDFAPRDIIRKYPSPDAPCWPSVTRGTTTVNIPSAVTKYDISLQRFDWKQHSRQITCFVLLYFVMFRLQISAQVAAAEFQRFVDWVERCWQPFPLSSSRRRNWEKQYFSTWDRSTNRSL